MTRWQWFICVVLGAISSGFALASPSTAELEHPNVLLILTDDQGYADLGFYGNPHVKTPHLDRLAQRSVRLADFQVSPTCSPTRAALLTGRHEFRVGITHTILGRSNLRADIPTLPELFQKAGYRTAIFGKWHLGDAYPSRPQDRGFGEVFVHGGGGIGQTPDHWGNTYFDATFLHNGQPVATKGYCTEVLVDRAWDWMKATKQPWLVYLSLNAPHTPLQIREEWAEPYRQMGLPEHLARFYAMIENLDQALGLLLDKLEQSPFAKRTIVVFLTDNGSAKGGKPSDEMYNAGLRGFKASPYQGGVRAPCFFYWPGHLEGGRDITQLTGAIDVLPTLAQLCHVSLQDVVGIEGRSLVPLLEGKGEVAWPERTLVTHVGRWPEGKPVENFKHRGSAIRNKRWALVNGKELYDLKVDPGQAKDLASTHPEIADDLSQQYDAWWKSIQDEIARLQPIVIGHPAAPKVELNCMDWRPSVAFAGEPMAPLWHQKGLRAMASGKPWRDVLGGVGAWLVKVEQPGKYRLTLRKLPETSSSELAAMKAGQARVVYGEEKWEAQIPKGAREVSLEVELPAGEGLLETVLTGQRSDGKPQGAYFVEIQPIQTTN